ncbi:MAG: homoserine dehydrogenase, partial [Bacillota bacterium]|nr:homoserine dehydrogenase [Bacillota bacterium]
AHIEAALRSGKHVVTANKGPIAWDYDRLSRLAADCGRRLLFEATVMDGAPVFNLARNCLRVCQVTSISGILNSTTNVILEKMGEGLTFAAALAAAQAMGVAEADPALDIDGHDSAAKLAALANVLMGAGMTPVAIGRNGIRHISLDDIAAAAAQGKTIKLLCEAWHTAGGEFQACIRPQALPAGHPYSGVAGTSSILTLQTDLLGRLTITEQSPGLEQTAYGVLADLVEIACLNAST